MVLSRIRKKNDILYTHPCDPDLFGDGTFRRTIEPQRRSTRKRKWSLRYLTSSRFCTDCQSEDSNNYNRAIYTTALKLAPPSRVLAIEKPVRYFLRRECKTAVLKRRSVTRQTLAFQGRTRSYPRTKRAANCYMKPAHVGVRTRTGRVS